MTCAQKAAMNSHWLEQPGTIQDLLWQAQEYANDNHSKLFSWLSRQSA
jgi:hypothetical protein